MKNKSILILIVAALLLASCGKPDDTSTSAPEAPKASSVSPPEVSSSEDVPAYDPNYPFYGNADFMQKAYAMGYSESLLELCWNNGHDEESLLNPPVSFVYDVSPNGKFTLYQGATTDGATSLGLEHVCLKNNETEEVIVLGSFLPGNMSMYASVSFCADDRISFLGQYGGAVYDLRGADVVSVKFDAEAAGYFIYEPVYNPETNRITGLGTSFKEGNSADYATDKDLKRTFTLIEADINGEILNAAITGIPMEVNRYNQIVVPTASYIRDGYLWIALTTTDNRYPFYRIDINGSYEATLVDSNDFRAVFPYYANKG